MNPLACLPAVHNVIACRDWSSTPPHPWPPLGLRGAPLGVETLQVSTMPSSPGLSPEVSWKQRHPSSQTWINKQFFEVLRPLPITASPPHPRYTEGPQTSSGPSLRQQDPGTCQGNVRTNPDVLDLEPIPCRLGLGRMGWGEGGVRNAPSLAERGQWGGSCTKGG